MGKRKALELDVREDIRRGREPFSRIMDAVAHLAPDQDLCLTAPFEPAPLYAVLAQHGLSHSATQTESGDWQVRFSHSQPTEEKTPAPKVEHAKACAGTPALDVDARGLEPPQPMVTVLEAASKLPRGACLRARTDRRPLHLYTELENRGFSFESREEKDGSFLTEIRHR